MFLFRLLAKIGKKDTTECQKAFLRTSWYVK